MEGRCLCGSVKFQLEGPLDFVAHCHCESCRLSRGAAFATWTSVPLERFKFAEGEENVSWYRSSETILWGFCKTCGSSMFYRAEKPGHPESPRTNVMYIAVGSITSPIDKPAGAHVSYEEHVKWIEGFEKLQKWRGKMVEKIS